jgi:hypothetical protein
MVFSRASHKCFSFNLSVGSLTWLTYALRNALSKDIVPGEFRLSNVHANFLLDWALQLMFVTVSSDCYIIKRHVSHAWYRCWTIKAMVEAEVEYDGFYCESWVHSSAVDHSQTFVLLLTSNYKTSIKPI